MDILQSPDPRDITDVLPGKLKHIDTLSGDCIKPVTEMAAAFQKVFELAIELSTCCSATQGSYNMKIADAEMQKKYYDTQKTALQGDLDAREADKKKLDEAVEDVSC